MQRNENNVIKSKCHVFNDYSSQLCPACTPKSSISSPILYKSEHGVERLLKNLWPGNLHKGVQPEHGLQAWTAD